MRVIADLHIHSKYSRAVSQQMIIPEIAKWADKKGINLVGTGDFTHPLWLRELKANLVEDRSGIFRVKDSKIKAKFLLTSEISSIYTQGGKCRRIHTLILAPSFETVDKIISELIKRGANLMSDGRPIIGLSAHDLAELVLKVDETAIIIPCHVWTPWFSLYGSMSGFDSIEECFGDQSKFIYGIETGLSSDPAMNWRIKELDKRSILSNSDSHSGIKLGREATVFEIDNEKYTYQDIAEAIKNRKIAYTIEFYPEEGKYHFTGHRNCHVRQSPEETLKLGSICPVCGKPLTVGVMHRVEDVSRHNKIEGIKQKENSHGVKWIGYDSRPPYIMLVPLIEIIAEAMSSTVSSVKVLAAYNNLIEKIGTEFKILLEESLGEIAKIAGDRISEGIGKVRAGNIVVEPGYDGEFGIVKIWSEKKAMFAGSQEDKTEVKPDDRKQMSLF